MKDCRDTSSGLVIAGRRAPLALLLTLAVACGTLVGNPEDDDDEGGDGTQQAGETAPVVFSLTDAPLDSAQSVLLTVAGLEVSPDGESWIDIPLAHEAEIDLLKYQEGDSLKLGEAAELPTGTYRQTRLRLAEDISPKLVLDDGTSHDLEVPSEDQTGLKIVTPFTVKAGEPLALTIDFDLRKSIKEIKGHNQGRRYKMKPVLRLLKDDDTGGITGDAGDGHVVCVYPAGSDRDQADDCEKSANSGKVRGGRFRIAYLPEGDYEILVFDKDGTLREVRPASVSKGQMAEIQDGSGAPPE